MEIMMLWRRRKIAEEVSVSAQMIAWLFIPAREFITCALDNVKPVLGIYVDHFCSTLSLKYFFFCYKIIETAQSFCAAVLVQQSFILGPNEEKNVLNCPFDLQK